MKKAAYIIMVITAGIFTACTLSEFYLEGYVVTNEVEDITSTSALCGGSAVIEKQGKDANVTVVERGIQYSEYKNLWDERNCLAAGTGDGDFTCILSGLQPGKTYYVRAYATVSNTYLPSKKTDNDNNYVENEVTNTQRYYGEEKTFTAEKLPPQEMTLPEVKTLRVENLKSSSMEVVIELSSLGGDASVSDVGVVLSSSGVPTIDNAERTASGGEKSETGSFKATFNNLQKGVKYYVRAYATNSKGTAYGVTSDATTPFMAVAGGLVAYYTFDSGNCNEMQNKTEFNGLLQGTGTPTFATDIPGSVGKSLQLNNDAYYYVASSPFNGITGEYTVCLWIKTMLATTCILDHQTTNDRPAIFVKDSKIYAARDGSTALYAGFNISITGLLLDGNWHLLAVTKTNKDYKLYIDGVYIAACTYNYTLYGDSPLLLGSGFTGKIDNFRVYNREITSDEIAEIYSAKQ
ncbi:MAG: LamG domain-containing protein [Prevotella sp.]|jgi:hypothetical protein|nr:LamG domain-containing protein [Prevotella sp.]